MGPYSKQTAPLRNGAVCFFEADLPKTLSPLPIPRSGARLGGLFLQGQMHALMTAILLRMARFDALNTSSQTQPPDGQLAEVEQRVSGSEGHTVVATDVGGQVAFLENPLKHCKSITLFRGGAGFTSGQKTAGMIAGEPQTASLRPSPNTPSKASLPPLLREERVTYVSGTVCYLCLRPFTASEHHQKTSPSSLKWRFCLSGVGPFR